MMKLAVLDSFEDRFLSSVLIELGQNHFFLVFLPHLFIPLKWIVRNNELGTSISEFIWVF